uniref:Uncharacterized protein n=1 Tax=Utricularia reniformis TaxID=192314 RepID=A0A1Y0B457_9LAMI|nr:hypothetical protein AEK19_MT2013 [Utricularia reniformis]ART32173.1 hypothetical protein AEK19_MT2013 [Utricularia reniformis]
MNSMVSEGKWKFHQFYVISDIFQCAPLPRSF